ncbi:MULTISPECIES: pyrroloquinoline quinone biosynthesis protein PqqE [Methylobacterium]|jgi:pyrroloquinoline quinone biosynthesis protein E|uniref:pyrroloquinoline quinone biosynthesis protein PqqE n=1 Tax=Methylobacterium TaxID=407 RepID=UPI0008E42C91|nr:MULTISPECIES: pyrroloquinoline quinone biosynthesis protein PqqE [Methylobacterium]MBK3396271.1 pyrroloquinoline quinone biosynthesis protein PqqE [Methylobacterium ajmalii]MBK3412262.1 pyrroloquinoline quinone biosynthesis protein PqqE [Methylobacterium ajmalii]MBK3421684.1 pyrroloquinoline quinone biosynthesis protein PqqE [Methylobacterium ajmalii]MBZ6415138.1 pyrroloquinoline quinone biosynthesis protein PqqE [Methylobacterium sp.]SFF59375.1 pyrroloquinoline quinone biosynthesis protein
MNAVAPPPLPAPIGLLAELTHRCPLRCPYCSNPLELDRRSAELDTATWQRVLREAAALGVLHVHLSGGEPTARQDIVEITRTCAELGLYSNLITSGVAGALGKLDALSEAGLDHVQLSVQAAEAGNAERIGGLKDAQPQKFAFAERVTALGLPLTLNAVIHRGNIAEVPALIDLAVRLGAKRLEVAHTQYYGWAYVNRAALMPAKPDVDRSIRIVEEARERLKGQLVIDLVVPDYYAKYPKACAGGWGRRLMNVTPTGKVLPCHAAETIPGLEFWHVQDRPLGEIWADSPAFRAYRGTEWMQEPCRSCDRREKDWGGCRCQALALAGDAKATDPACSLSPLHGKVQALAVAESALETAPDYQYRTIGGAPRVATPEGAPV